MAPDACTQCRLCENACPYGARSVDFDNEEVRINPVMCQGCGACAAVCPNGAAVLLGWGKQQALEMIDTAFAE